MEQRPEGEITDLLERMRAGEDGARQRLWEAVESQVRSVAAKRLHGEPEHIDTTSLVHETYVRIFGGVEIGLENRAHFFGAVARAVEQALIRRARERRRRAKPMDPDTLAETVRSATESFHDPDELALLVAAIERLAARPRQARRVEMLRLAYFGGLRTNEIAQLFGVSIDTVQRDLRLVRIWLARELMQGRGE